MVHEDGRVPCQAAGLIEKMECFEFVFILKLMLKVLGITNELSHLLQRKDINIVNALEVSTLFIISFLFIPFSPDLFFITLINPTNFVYYIHSLFKM